MRSAFVALAGALLAVASTGCATAVIEPGHRGLLFTPHEGALKREILPPGAYNLGFCFVACTSDRIDDFDVTYSSRREPIHTLTSEGLPVDVTVSVIYRPVIAELYQLDTEIGPAYYDEVVGPEARSAVRGVLARHGLADLHARDEVLEDEMERELRQRTTGKHVEIASVTVESVSLPPEIVEALRRKAALAADEARQRAAEDADFERRKRAIERENELKRLRQEPACAPAAPPTSSSGTSSGRWAGAPSP